MVLSTFSAYASVFMLLEVDLNGGDGGAGGQKGRKGMGGNGGQPGLPRSIGKTYETIGHTQQVTVRGGGCKDCSIPDSTFSVVTRIECIPHDLIQQGHRGKGGRPGRENMEARSRGQGTKVDIQMRHSVCECKRERE